MIDILTHEPRTLLLAIAGGFIPALFWLWFWLRQEDKEEPEPKGLIAIAFILGGLTMFVAMFLEKLTVNIADINLKIIVWAAIEEIVKFSAIGLLIYKNSNVDQPIDFPVYFITGALGFAAFENFLYLLNPISASGSSIAMATGLLRFIGSTLLHAIASGMIGSALGLAFFSERLKKTYLLIGIVAAILLHSVFNFFIMKGSGEDTLSILGFLWVVTIINILVFEKLKRMAKYISPQNKIC